MARQAASLVPSTVLSANWSERFKQLQISRRARRPPREPDSIFNTHQSKPRSRTRLSTLVMENTMSLSQQELIDAISSLTLLEAAELSKALQEKFGVSAAAPVAYAAAPGAAAGDAAAVPDLPTSFDVVL